METSSELIRARNQPIFEECIINECEKLGKGEARIACIDSPECLFEENSEEADPNTRADLNDDLNEITTSLEVLAHHETRWFPH